ncbi:MAG: hypothetical protein JXR63_12660 [Spirochaetales bacterium]|nr:hypothetical protein [Spirochaetales bacterium]
MRQKKKNIIIITLLISAQAYSFSIIGENSVRIDNHQDFKADFIYNLAEFNLELNSILGLDYLPYFANISNYNFRIVGDNLFVGGFSLSPFLRTMNSGDKLSINQIGYFDSRTISSAASNMLGFGLFFKEKIEIDPLLKNYIEIDLTLATALCQENYKIFADFDFTLDKKWGIQAGFVFSHRRQESLDFGNQYYLDFSKSFSDTNLNLASNFSYNSDSIYFGILLQLSLNPFFDNPGVRLLSYGVFDIGLSSKLVLNCDLLMNYYTDGEFLTFPNDFRLESQLKNRFKIEEYSLDLNFAFEFEYHDRQDLFFIFDAFSLSYLFELAVALNSSKIEVKSEFLLDFFQDKQYEGEFKVGLDLVLLLFKSDFVKIVLTTGSDIEINYRGKSKFTIDGVLSSEFKYTRINLKVGYSRGFYWTFLIYLRFENMKITIESEF